LAARGLGALMFALFPAVQLSGRARGGGGGGGGGGGAGGGGGGGGF